MPTTGVLTVAGIYALGRYSQQFIPNLSITVAVELDPRSGQRTRALAHLDSATPDEPFPTVHMTMINDELEQQQLPITKNEQTDISLAHPSKSANILEMIAQEPLTLRQIANRSGLSVRQARHRLDRLIDEGKVTINGGWGIHSTTYAAQR